MKAGLNKTRQCSVCGKIRKMYNYRTKFEVVCLVCKAKPKEKPLFTIKQKIDNYFKEQN